MPSSMWMWVTLPLHTVTPEDPPALHFDTTILHTSQSPSIVLVIRYHVNGMALNCTAFRKK
jgi:hypothetical protein